ncbi:MAG: TetR/AcrR family transcriptional regulator [Coriobacteriales bacterium]|jgi:AcrR family transcriptional regulator
MADMATTGAAERAAVGEGRLDLRIERTYRSLVDAFTRLLERQPYERISISELCDEAMIRRTTFYKHFADKQEFFRFYLSTFQERFHRRIAQRDSVGQPTTPLEYEMGMDAELVDFLCDNEALVNSLLSSNVSGMLIEEMSDLIQAEVARRIARARAEGPAGMAGASAGVSAIDAASFLAGGILQTTRTWWQTRRGTESPDELKRSLQELSALVIRGTC